MTPILLSTFLSTAEARKKEPFPNPMPQGNFYLRDFPDSDPVDYLGGFIFEDTQFPDESLAFKTECSEYIDVHFVDGGNWEASSVMNASATLATGLSIPGMKSDGGNVGYEGGYGVRVSYTVTRKMKAVISNPQEFTACCQRAPNNCSEQYISEFIQGSGSLWRAHSHFTGMRGFNKLKKSLPVDVEVAGEYNWVSSRHFTTPVYFAYKVSPVPLPPNADRCKEMIDAPPKSDDGIYFAGVSTKQDNEVLARTDAEYNAKKNISRYIATEMKVTQSTSEEEFYTASSEIISKKAKLERFCPIEATDLGGYNKYVARVLYFVSNEDLAELSSQVEERKQMDDEQ